MVVSLPISSATNRMRHKVDFKQRKAFLLLDQIPNPRKKNPICPIICPVQKTDYFMSFPRVFGHSERQAALKRIWTRVTDSFPYSHLRFALWLCMICYTFWVWPVTFLCICHRFWVWHVIFFRVCPLTYFLYYCNIRIRKMFICLGIPKHRNTDDTRWFRYEMFIDFMSLVFRHEERERRNFYYADCSIWPNKRVTHPVVSNWTGLAQAQKSTGLARRQKSSNCFFQKSPKFPAPRFRAWRHSHTIAISYLGFLLWHLWLSYPPRTSVNCTQICAPARALSQMVLSLTKPNDKI